MLHTTRSTQRSFTHSASRATPSRVNPSRCGMAQLRVIAHPALNHHPVQSQFAEQIVQQRLRSSA